MNERLSEQAFDMLFENPPEALAALKGSPKLAELKVLPGRAPVPGRGGSESVASGENDLKNAEIEANRGKTQAVEPQQNRAQNPDVDGEKRSQPRDQDSLGH